jgi:hypothetical protein
VGWAEKAAGRGDLTKAKRYLDRASGVLPSAQSLAAARSRLLADS